MKTTKKKKKKVYSSFVVMGQWFHKGGYVIDSEAAERALEASDRTSNVPRGQVRLRGSWEDQQKLLVRRPRRKIRSLGGRRKGLRGISEGLRSSWESFRGNREGFTVGRVCYGANSQN